MLAPVLNVFYALTAREAACLRQAIAQQVEARAATRVTGAKKLDLPRSADYWWAFAGRFGIILGLGLWQGYRFYILSNDNRYLLPDDMSDTRRVNAIRSNSTVFAFVIGLWTILLH